MTVAADGDPLLPSLDDLRREARAGAEAFVEALMEAVPKSEIAGIYLKGSAFKPWDSHIDYVPVLSDVDVHLLLTHEDMYERRLGSLRQAMTLAKRAEALYHAAIPNPIHVPRIQLVIANRLYKEPGFIPSPIETVEERFGAPYPRLPVDLARSRQSAIDNLVLPETGDLLRRLPERVADLTGPHLRGVLRDLSWRVSPAGPRVLELLGVDFRKCWTSNRTRIVDLLTSAGERELSLNYRAFYLGGLQYFLSQDQDGEAARGAIVMGVLVLEGAFRVAYEARVRDAAFDRRRRPDS